MLDMTAGHPKVFFTSDSHFGHANVIKYCERPFVADADRVILEREGAWRDGRWTGRFTDHRMSMESVELMDATLIDAINEIVGVDDILWHLGDFCFGKRDRKKEIARAYRDRIRCRNVNLILGNHDDVRILRDLFSEVRELSEIRIDNQDIVMCHYAMATFNKSHYGSWQLYGHSHGMAERVLDVKMPGRKSVDVGVDYANAVLGSYRPWSFDELKSLFQDRPGFKLEHHR